MTSGGDTDTDGHAITYACVYDNTIDGSVGAGTACTALVNEGGGNPSFNTSTGVFSAWTPRVLDNAVDFEFKITATDIYSATDTEIFSTNVKRFTFRTKKD